MHPFSRLKGEKGSFLGDVVLYSDDKSPVVELKGVRIRQFADTDNKDLPVKEIAVSATFTSEPIEQTLKFWAGQWGQRADVRFAPYNQPFQELLNPSSLLSSNKDGVNVLLLRFEDWIKGEDGLQLQVDAAQKDELLAGRQTHTLPNDAVIAHVNPYESDYLYKEIFVDRAYLRHGITMEAGDCVIDVGANIGMFTMFVLQEAPGASVYSFEPSPAVYDALNTNAQLYGEHVKAFNCGLSDRNGEASFTFYKHSSVFSSYHADTEADHAAIRTVVENVLHQQEVVDQDTLEVLTEDFMEDRTESETFACPIRTLSSIIDEEESRRSIC